MCELAHGTGWLLGGLGPLWALRRGQDDEVDASVLVATFAGAIFRHGTRFAKALGIEPGGRDAVLAEPLSHRAGASLRQALVKLGRAAIIGVTFHAHSGDVAAARDGTGNSLKHRVAARQDNVPVGREEHGLHDTNATLPNLGQGWAAIPLRVRTRHAGAIHAGVCSVSYTVAVAVAVGKWATGSSWIGLRSGGFFRALVLRVNYAIAIAIRSRTAGAAWVSEVSLGQARTVIVGIRHTVSIGVA